MSVAPESSTWEHLLVERDGRVGVVTLNRPQALNALNGALMAELQAALQALDNDPAIGCLVLTGSDKAFAAGADIREMATATAMEMTRSPLINGWETLAGLETPLVAAVSGWCLGGGCELALLCDIIIASETATFGQPEVNIGVIPGAGGTQRLVRAVGKSLAMEMILADRRLTADEALRAGLVSRVAPVESYRAVALEVAAAIADKARLAVRAAKEAINQAFEGSLAEGLRQERLLFSLLFASEDQKEGMAAFVEKRAPVWRGR
jgi:enoyl-CoA hydratase